MVIVCCTKKAGSAVGSTGGGTGGLGGCAREHAGHAYVRPRTRSARPGAGAGIRHAACATGPRTNGGGARPDEANMASQVAYVGLGRPDETQRGAAAPAVKHTALELDDTLKEADQVAPVGARLTISHPSVAAEAVPRQRSVTPRMEDHMGAASCPHAPRRRRAPAQRGGIVARALVRPRLGVGVLHARGRGAADRG